MFCGGPYGALTNFKKGFTPDSLADHSLNFVKKYQSLDLIDDPSNIKDMPVYIFSGAENDETVKPYY